MNSTIILTVSTEMIKLWLKVSTYLICICVSSRKDIHDLDGIHGYWQGTAAVALIVHNNHEEVAAGNLLNNKWPADQRRTQTRIKML